MRFLFACASVLLLSACASNDDPGAAADAWAVAAANPVGPPISCIEKPRIRGTAILDARTIDFSLDDGAVLRNRLPNACPRLVRDGRFVYRTALERVCSTDLITLVQSDGRAGDSCGLGLFQPIVVPPRQGRSAGD
jgi:hypothetical protein